MYMTNSEAERGIQEIGISFFTKVAVMLQLYQLNHSVRNDQLENMIGFLSSVRSRPQAVPITEGCIVI